MGAHTFKDQRNRHTCANAHLHSHYILDVDFCRFNLFKLLLVVGFFHSSVRLHCAFRLIWDHTLLMRCVARSVYLRSVNFFVFVHIWWRIEIIKFRISDAFDTMRRLVCLSSAKTGRWRKTAKIKLNGEFRLLWLKNYDARSGQRIFIKLMPNKLFPFLAECCCCCCGCRRYFFSSSSELFFPLAWQSFMAFVIVYFLRAHSFHGNIWFVSRAWHFFIFFFRHFYLIIAFSTRVVVSICECDFSKRSGWTAECLRNISFDTDFGRNNFK